MSWSFANNSYPQSITFLQKPNLFNVAITRARSKCINFISRDMDTMPEKVILEIMFHLLNSIRKEKPLLLTMGIDENIYKNKLEREVAESIRKLEHRVVARGRYCRT